MRGFSKEIIEKIKAMPDEKRKQILDGLVKLYAVRPHRASEEFVEKGSPITEVGAASLQRD